MTDEVKENSQENELVIDVTKAVVKKLAKKRNIKSKFFKKKQ